MKTARLLTLLLIFALVAAARPSEAAGLAVDLKNDDSRSISVPVGSDRGITPESDFEVLVGGDQTVPVFPAEIFKDRFWSAPLSPEDYDAIRTGLPVQPLAADKTTHKLMRKLAAEQRKTLKKEQAETKRAVTGKSLADLKERRSRLQAQKEKIEGWIADADRGLADEKARVQWREDSAEDDIARSKQRIDDLTDQRNELQAQRDALPARDRAGRDRLTGQITSLNGRISSERNTLRLAEEHKRDSKTFLRGDVRDRRQMIADRDALVVEIKAIDRQISALSGQ